MQRDLALCLKHQNTTFITTCAVFRRMHGGELVRGQAGA